jgi:hypothetical protein
MPNHAEPGPASRPKQPSSSAEGSLPLIAYELHRKAGFKLIPAPATRAWMAATPARFANRCLPLLMANQAGWLVLNNEPVTCMWSGDRGLDGVTVHYGKRTPLYHASSHFGEGIVTWNLPFLFRTPPGYNLLVRGPANWVKDGACPLEGIVETDWSAATFTMNWKLTRHNVWITFDADEPLCMLVPQRRGELEEFQPEIAPIAADSEARRSYDAWVASRARFLGNLAIPGSEEAHKGWQKHYFQGGTPDGSSAPAHQTRLRLRRFLRGESPRA